MVDLLQNILRSFSVQLLLLHLRSNFLLLVVWALLLLMMSGLVGPQLGLQYLFLDPEYLNRTDFWSFLIVGIAYGFFAMTWNLSTYLLIGGYFNFLASLSRPFFKFCINNALLPLGVLFFYFGLLVRFFRLDTDSWILLESLSGLALGVVISLFLYALYFNLTNRDISYYRPRHRERPPNMGPGEGTASAQGHRPYRAQALAPVLTRLYDNPYRVRTYLNEGLKTRLVRSVAHYESSVLQGIFRQNHLNAILLQVITALLLAGLGLLIDRPLFQIPAGASFLVMLSLVIAFIGAVSYWFSEWRVTLLLLSLVAINVLTSAPWFQLGNQAYGLDYNLTAAYSEDRLQGLYGSPKLAEDIAATTAILENWKAKQNEERPPLVIVCASGGGLTAALWATHIAQTIEGCSDGAFLHHTALMTGASGGQIGLAYLREAYLSDPNFRENDVFRLDRISRDLLNPVAFSIVSNDVFLPLARVTVGGKSYRRDRAYGFERELAINTDHTLDKAIWTYREPERTARIPLLFVTPSIVDDGRRMVISPQGVTYMTASEAATRGNLALMPDMVDFRWLLAGQDADSLRFITALRMNATYPYVLPLVRLPTTPVIRLMDAGYRDNYGITSAVRFVSVFRDWILENTSGVHIVQISAFREREPEPEAADNRGVVSSLFRPVGVAGNILSVQILDQEVLLGQLAATLGPENFHLYRFNYQPAADDPLRTSVSFHLTEQERRQVLRASQDPAVQVEMDRLVRMLQ
ncbi:hypothetical protein QWY85_03045 [Neolewinella lacunae]|uniref:PNPLA domain-containing protein n=1 Tax=Neolewinella lacunae TaxID=1517758 RepID=A0A923PPE4_9BACT|nr:hypothetical protein [Neolewinella lacunae]MBC6996441.1 hypothetical protein [Neolewinella lacunae]MDN3633616.1 hypothetical protein [Neolewinella lacunae]